MRKLLVVCLFLFFGTVQSQSYLFKTWTTANGLTVSDINEITQDPKGYLWLATEGGGLSRFDGMKFQHFGTESGLPSEFISTLVWGKDSVLCIGTEKGICFYDGIQFSYLDDIAEQYKARVIDFAFVRDTLFVAFKHRLAYYYNGKVAEYGPAAYFSNQKLYQLLYDGQKLSVVCDSGVVLVPSLHKEVAEPTSYYFENERFSLRYGKNKGELWLTDAGLPLLVDTLDVPGGVKDATVWNEELVYTNDDALGMMHQDGSYSDVSLMEGLNVDRTKCLFVDRYNNLWVGGYDGLAKWVNPNVQNYSLLTGLEDQRVHSIFPLEEEVWFGTNSGIELFDNQGYHTFEEVSEGVVFHIMKDSHEILWFATESGLISFDGIQFKRFGAKEGLDDYFIFDVKETMEGQLIVATGSSIYLQNDTGFEPLLPSDAVGASAIKFDHFNTLWFLSLDGRLGSYKEGKTKYLDSLGSQTLDSYRVSCLEIAMEDKIWLGTQESGVLYWDGSSLSVFNKASGLVSNKIEGILSLDANEVWILYENSVQLLKVRDGVWEAGKIYDSNSGFLGSGSYTNALFWDEYRQYIWVGTSDGAVSVNRQEESSTLVQFEPLIQSIDLFFKPALWDGKKKSPWNNVPEKLELKYDENYLTFHYGASSSGDPSNLYYRYKLRGQDQNWTLGNESFSAIYTDISHGSYTFLLEVAENSNFSNARQASIPVRIIPPFYKTFWFWALIVIFFGGLIGWAIRSRINQLNEKMQLRTALADSERKALRLQMNPHFIFNALDSISGFIFKNEPKLAVTYLNSFAKLMRLTLESSRQMLVPLQSEINLIKNYLLLEQVRFNNSFDFDIEIEDEIDDYVVMLPPMVIQPNLENAILHGMRYKEEKGHLSIFFKLKNGELLCIIQDDGIGREAAMAKKVEQKKHKGLSTNITKERMSLLSKSLERRFTYTIEDVKNDLGEAKGTKVTLTFPYIEDEDFEE